MTRETRNKIIITLLFALCCVCSYGQSVNFRSISFCTATYNDYYDRWNSWSRPDPSDVLINFNFDLDIVTIYSPVVQTYYIKEFVKRYQDSDGDIHIIYKFIDQDRDIGNMKLLQKKTGESQVYIIFSDIAWCYEVKRIE